ncbi:hypothetical protein DUNSADRAFT_4853 [Dunaliella salina]|uniref:Vps53 N-terminal domain-containing protein n=1 Tax=Dunaliella salina TaxID=3046 RepID=A0ABQ7GR38_DUNSA|nr:hypothetical protein DUNSADRAFT_4853 [Dunaliella salina]|eukprot:KAF5837072.1 hypothetical protein DUNSADRAFT_4853 [Dunaliella salina]
MCYSKQIRNGDKEIFRAVRTQGGAHAQARQELEHGQGQILDLFQQVTKIQTKAEESENVVQDICRGDTGFSTQGPQWKSLEDEFRT